MGNLRPDGVPEVVAALREQLDELADLVEGLSDADWAKPSACDGWSVSDVLLHLAETNDVAIASVEGRWDEVARMWGGGPATETVDALAGASVEQRRAELSPADVHAWWLRTRDDMATAFERVDPAARVQWVVGDMAARTLCTTRLSETWIHANDIAFGLGVSLEPQPRLWHVCRLVHRTLPYAFERAGREDGPGPVRFELTPPGGDDPWTFGDPNAPTVVRGPAVALCRVAGQRGTAADHGLAATGEAADDVLALMRTFA